MPVPARGEHGDELTALSEARSFFFPGLNESLYDPPMTLFIQSVLALGTDLSPLKDTARRALEGLHAIWSTSPPMAPHSDRTSPVSRASTPAREAVAPTFTTRHATLRNAALPLHYVVHIYK